MGEGKETEEDATDEMGCELLGKGLISDDAETGALEPVSGEASKVDVLEGEAVLEEGNVGEDDDAEVSHCTTAKARKRRTTARWRG